MDELDKMIQDRNDLLLDFFRHHLPKDNVRLVGNPNAPAIIINNHFIANCYVKNFTIHFTDGNKNGNVVGKHKMNTAKVDNYGSKEVFLDWFHSYPMKRCFKIKLDGTHLYMVGLSYTDGDTDNGDKYPVFAEYEPKIFFTRDYATQLLADLEDNALIDKVKLEVE